MTCEALEIMTQLIVQECYLKCEECELMSGRLEFEILLESLELRLSWNLKACQWRITERRHPYFTAIGSPSPSLENSGWNPATLQIIKVILVRSLTLLLHLPSLPMNSLPSKDTEKLLSSQQSPHHCGCAVVYTRFTGRYSLSTFGTQPWQLQSWNPPHPTQFKYSFQHPESLL